LSRLLGLLSLLLLFGCTIVPATSPQAQLRLSPQANLPVVSPPSPAVLPPLAAELRAESLPPLPGDRVAADADSVDPDDTLVATSEDEEPLDPETLEDNAVLQAVDIAPPEEEGESVFLDESNLDFPVVDNDKVRYFIDYFSGPVHRTMRTWLERSGRYLPMMQEVFAEAGLPRDLVYLAMIESGFNNKALSRSRASGPWQFMEGTGRLYGLSTDWWQDERRDPEKATRAAARHLADLYRMFDGDWYLALAAYNAGAGKIKRAIERYGTNDFWELTHGSYLKEETKHYVPKMLAGLLIAKHPERYGFTELNYHQPLAYERIEIATTTDLEVIARLAESDVETIRKLNPELKRWSTPPDKSNYQLRLPVGSGEAFVERYAKLPENQRVRVIYHLVKKGDTPGALARRYGVRSDDILRFNKVRNARSLRIGQQLLIPTNPQAGGMSLAELRASLEDDLPAAKNRSQRSAGKQHYTVRSGDSLWTIARRFKVAEQQLRAWNRLGSKTIIKPGQTLVVANGSAKQAVAAATAQPAAKSGRAELKKIVYQVRPGDTLWGISRQFDVDSDQIRGWNKLPHNPVLRPGQRLTLLVKSNSRA